MRLFTLKINLFLIIAGLFLLFLRVQPVQAAHEHGMSPRDGYVKTPTGAPVAGITVVEYSDTCPSEYVRSVTLPQCQPPLANCHSERRTVTDTTGYYYFAPMTPPQPADACNDLNAWWRFTCSNPDVFYKILTPQGQQVQGVNIIRTAQAVESSASVPPIASGSPEPSSECAPVKHETSNIVESITKDITCNPPPACNTTCQKSGDCVGGVRDGCTTCIEGVCKPPPACNTACERDGQCIGAKDGCTQCLPKADGSGKSCQTPPPVCGDKCTNASDCSRAIDGCTACVPNNGGTGSVCAPPPACGAGCVRDDQCAGATKDGCTVCLPGNSGTGKVCSKPPACNVSCTKDDQCTDAKDGCIECAPDGTGKTSCQTAFNNSMCKCDGFNALNISNPSQGNFQFEAFAKVEGKDVSRAQVKDMKFTLYKSPKNNPNISTIVASGTMIPQIVSSTDGKVRYRAVWSITPPAYDANAVYRVGAEPTCIRKPLTASASASLNFSSVNNLLSSDNSKVLGTELDYSPAKLVQNNLELGTLDDGFFTRIVETDSCRFIRFEYGQY